MPALQSSGQISLLDIQTEFGGTNPIGMNEYYLNGIYVTGTGAAGIPTSGTISLFNFYGKEKVVSPPSVVVPAPVQTNFVGTYLNPFPGGSTSYEAITGCSGTNITRPTGVSTFNNIGTQARGRANVLYYANLILQARVGDIINISVNINVGGAGDPQGIRIYINYGAGYGNIYTLYPTTGNGTRGTNYTIPSVPPGNYAICCTNEFSTTGAGYRSVNLYSLHIF
jgi:hypothetical protein